MISKWVAEAWKEVLVDRECMIETFRKTGLFLPIDGSQDHQMSFHDVGATLFKFLNKWSFWEIS